MEMLERVFDYLTENYIGTELNSEDERWYFDAIEFLADSIYETD